MTRAWVSPWPLHIEVRPRRWPVTWRGRRFRYAEWDFENHPFRNVIRMTRDAPYSETFAIGVVEGPDGRVHARQMGTVFEYNPGEAQIGVHCGQVRGRRPVDFRYDLRVTCMRCLEALDRVLRHHGREYRRKGVPVVQIARDQDDTPLAFSASS